jgi:hypothetical protein
MQCEMAASALPMMGTFAVVHIVVILLYAWAFVQVSLSRLLSSGLLTLPLLFEVPILFALITGLTGLRTRRKGPHGSRSTDNLLNR